MGLRNGPAACDVLFETGRCSRGLFQRTMKRYETCGGRRASVVSTRPSCYLKPSSQLAVPVPRQSYLKPKPDSRWCVGESSGKAQLAGFAECNMSKAHRCHGGGRGDCAADSQGFRWRWKRERREREGRKVRKMRKCSTWRHYKKPSSNAVIARLAFHRLHGGAGHHPPVRG